jgi:hypothetical protein
MGVFVILGAGVILLVALTGILPRFVGPDPVITTTFTPAPTATLIPATPSKTPKPELGFTIAEPQEVSKRPGDVKTLEDLAVERYSEASRNRINTRLIYTINSRPDVPVLWSWGWCAATEKILEENLTKMSFLLDADGYTIPKERFAKSTYEIDTHPTYEGWACVTYETILRDWKPGTYKLKETINFLSTINDGKDIFEVGYMIVEYTVNISQ